MTICSGASQPCAVIRSAIDLPGLYIRSLHIDSADAELFVAKKAAVVRGHIVFDEIEIAFDLADEIGLVATGIEIAVPDLPVVVWSYGIVALANMHADMHVFGNIFDHLVDHVNRSRNITLALKP